MPAPIRKYAALDADFLLALAEGHDDYAGVVDWLQQAANAYCIVTSTVLQELTDIQFNAESETIRKAAHTALGCITNWGFYSVQLPPLENGFTLELAKALQRKALSENSHLNDGLVVAEAAFQRCSILITSREELLNTHADAIRLALMEADAPINDLFVISADHIAAYARKTSDPTVAAEATPEDASI